MSRADPQAPSGAPVYPPTTCTCGHPKGLHKDASGKCQMCRCGGFTGAGSERTCKVCGARLSVFEQMREPSDG